MVLLCLWDVDIELCQKFLKQRSRERYGKPVGIVVVIAAALQRVEDPFEVLRNVFMQLAQVVHYFLSLAAARRQKQARSPR